MEALKVGNKILFELLIFFYATVPLNQLLFASFSFLIEILKTTTESKWVKLSKKTNFKLRIHEENICRVLNM